MIQMLLFVTPVIYPLNIVESGILRNILALNPMYASIEMFRAGLTGVFPDLQLLMFSIISSFVLLFTGIYYLRKTEYYFADLA
jgi:lipopolysaccharide transport system permease protein